MFNGNPDPPKCVTDSGAFIVDLKKHTFEDVMSDDNGAYKWEGSPSNTFFFNFAECAKVRQIDNKWYRKIRHGKRYFDEEVPLESIFTLLRTYRRHKTQPGFTNIMCRVKSVLTNEYQRYGLMIYQWDKTASRTEEVQAGPHGNARKPNSLATPYIRTSPSVLSNIREDLQNGMKPTKAYENAMEKSGGPFQSTSQCQEPRNLKQVSLINYLSNVIY